MKPRPFARAHLGPWILCLTLATTATLLLTTSCQRGSSLAGACDADSDCDAGFHCVRGTGVCITSTTPLNADAGIDARDGASDGASDLLPASD
jgi:hypothetical protein